MDKLWGAWLTKGYWTDFFLTRWFSPLTRAVNTDLREFYERQLDSMLEENLYKYVQGFHSRRDMSEELKKITCPVLIFVGTRTELENETIHMLPYFQDKQSTDWIRTQNTGLLITAEKPLEMIRPLQLFFNGMGIYHHIPFPFVWRKL